MRNAEFRIVFTSEERRSLLRSRDEALQEEGATYITS